MSPCRAPGATPQAQLVIVQMCGGSVDLARLLPPPLEPDPIEAAAVIVACATRTCDPTLEPADRLPPLTVAWDLAMRVAPDAVTAAVAATSLPARTRRDYLARYRAARARVLDLVTAEGDHFRDVFLRPVTDARATRAAADASLADARAADDDLAADVDRAILAAADTSDDADAPAPALADVTARVRRARRAYLAACRPVLGGVGACLADRHGRALTRLLAHLADAAGDPILAAVEHAVLDQLPDLADPRAAEYAAARAAYDAEAARLAEYTTMRARVTDPAVLAERWPDAPYDLARAKILIAPRTEPGADRLVTPYAAGADTVVEQLRSVRRHGDRAVLTWRRRTQPNSIGTGCYETSKVVGVDSYGNVNYETRCTGERRWTDDVTLAPVEVPWDDAADLVPGEIVAVVAAHPPQTDGKPSRRPRPGHVVFAARKPKDHDDHFSAYARDLEQTQWRAYRLAAPAAPGAPRKRRRTP
ncbi:MAG: hypothetical protein H6708_02800 [Kofleriaceae bacterium]|nr:hypothetical protein [Kofleriaceae bacterium]